MLVNMIKASASYKMSILHDTSTSDPQKTDGDIMYLVISITVCLPHIYRSQTACYWLLQSEVRNREILLVRPPHTRFKQTQQTTAEGKMTYFCGIK